MTNNMVFAKRAPYSKTTLKKMEMKVKKEKRKSRKKEAVLKADKPMPRQRKSQKKRVAPKASKPKLRQTQLKFTLVKIILNVNVGIFDIKLRGEYIMWVM